VAEAVRAELVARGFDVVSAIGQPVPVSRAPGEGLPLDDAAAATLSAAVGAGGAVVMGVRVARDGAIRGTSLLGAVSEVAVRVIDASSADSNGEGAAAEVAMTRLSEAGAGPEAGAAAEAAARAGGVAAIAAIADRAADYWPAPVRADGAVTVQIEGYRTWLTVEAILRTLSGTRGVTQVWPQALGRRRVVLAVVTGLAPQRVAAVIRRADLPSGRARAKPAGPGAVIVRISGETRPGAD
jgi:hypothetical protein